jgi:hypothetical protein
MVRKEPSRRSVGLRYGHIQAFSDSLITEFSEVQRSPGPMQEFLCRDRGIIALRT